MDILFILFCMALIVLALRLDKGDTIVNSLYAGYKCEPAEDGCVHEVVAQPVYDTSTSAHEQPHTGQYVDALGYDVHKCPNCGDETMGWNDTKYCCTGCSIVGLK